MTINPDGRQSEGVPPTGSGYSAEPEPCFTVSAVPVSIPNAARCDNCNNVRWVCENHPDHPFGGMVDSMAACECGAGEPCSVCSAEARWSEPLFDALKHGDADHRAWLRGGIHAFFAGRAVPPPRGAGNKEKRIDELEAALSKLLSAVLAIAEQFKIDVAAEMVRDPQSSFALAINVLASAERREA